MLAEETVTAGDHEWNDNPIAGLDSGHRRSRLFDDAHELVAENIAVLDRRYFAPVQMQVRAADRGGGHPQNNVV